jgi:hypothetical protein
MRAATLPAIGLALLALAGCQTDDAATPAAASSTPSMAAEPMASEPMAGESMAAEPEGRPAGTVPVATIGSSDVAQKCTAELARMSGAAPADIRATGIRLGQGGTTMVELELGEDPYLCRTDTAGNVRRVDKQARG